MRVFTTAVLALAILPAAQANALSVQEQTSMAEQRAALLANADQDGDGNITREEYDATRSQAFDRADQDADGYLNPSERSNAEALAQLGHSLAASDLRVQAASAALGQARGNAARNPDTDGDGQLSRAEYLAMPTPGFDRIDQNADGVMSADELAAVQSRPARRLRRNP